MKNVFYMSILCLFILLSSCVTNGLISQTDAIDASKNAVRIEGIINELSDLENINNRLNDKESDKLIRVSNLLDELELAIEQEKADEYNKGLKTGFTDGYKQALDDFKLKYKDLLNEEN